MGIEFYFTFSCALLPRAMMSPTMGNISPDAAGDTLLTARVMRVCSSAGEMSAEQIKYTFSNVAHNEVETETQKFTFYHVFCFFFGGSEQYKSFQKIVRKREKMHFCGQR